MQNDVNNRFGATTMVVPLTGARNIAHRSPIYVLAARGNGGLKEDRLVLCNQIRTLSHLRFGRVFGILSPETMRAMDRALAVSLGLARGGKA